MTIAERIAYYCHEKGIKQNTVAEASGVSAPTLSGWLRQNVESIPSSTIVPMAKLFGISPVELLTGEKYVGEDKGTEIQRLVDMYEALDWEGRHMVMASAISETRRTEDSIARARTRV